MVTVISTFAGCGGSSLGYKLAGYKELLAIDFDKHAVKTFKANFNVPVWERDISQVSSKEILDFCNLGIGELDVLDGSPPCQGFSMSGGRKVNDVRNSLFLEFKRLIKELQPKVFLMENVSAMTKGKMRGKYLEIIKSLKELNYIVISEIMNSQYFNVPQSRERLIFLGVRKDLDIFPTLPNPQTKPIPLKVALNNCPNKTFAPISKYANTLFPLIKEGKCARDSLTIDQIRRIVPKLEEKIKKNSFDSVYRKLDLNKPSPTIVKTFREDAVELSIHPENRYLTIEEVKRICSFPDNFILEGSFKEQWARLGNAVMPNFMFYIAKHIKEKVLEKAQKTQILEANL